MMTTIKMLPIVSSVLPTSFDVSDVEDQKTNDIVWSFVTPGFQFKNFSCFLVEGNGTENEVSNLLSQPTNQSVSLPLQGVPIAWLERSLRVELRHLKKQVSSIAITMRNGLVETFKDIPVCDFRADERAGGGDTEFNGNCYITMTCKIEVDSKDSKKLNAHFDLLAEEKNRYGAWVGNRTVLRGVSSFVIGVAKSPILTFTAKKFSRHDFYDDNGWHADNRFFNVGPFASLIYDGDMNGHDINRTGLRAKLADIRLRVARV